MITHFIDERGEAQIKEMFLRESCPECSRQNLNSVLSNSKTSLFPFKNSKSICFKSEPSLDYTL